MDRGSMTGPQRPHWSSGVRQHASAVRHPAVIQPRAHGEPAAGSAFGEPERSEQGCSRGEHASAAGPTPTHFRGEHARSDQREEPRATAHVACRHDEWQHRELEDEACGPRELVIRLSHALRPEVARRGWASRDVEIERHRFVSARCAHRSHELEVFEHGASVVATGGLEHRPPNAEGAGPVSAGQAVEERAAGIPCRVPGQRLEVVLGADDMGGLQFLEHARQGGFVVADVVVGDDERLVRREAYAGENTTHLAHGRDEISGGAHVAYGGRPGVRMRGEYVIRRSINHNDLGASCHPRQVASKISAGERVVSAQRQDVSKRSKVVFHGARMGNLRACPRGVRA